MLCYHGMKKYLDAVGAMRLQKPSSCGQVEMKTAREEMLIQIKNKKQNKREEKSKIPRKS